MNEGYRWKKKLFSEQGRALLEKLSLNPVQKHASVKRALWVVLIAPREDIRKDYLIWRGPCVI
jgi:hypothetical protein